MLIELRLIKKDSQMIVGGAPEFEDCAMRLDYCVSMGRHDANPGYSEIFFKGFGQPLLVAEPYEELLARVNKLATQYGAGRGFVQYES